MKTKLFFLFLSFLILRDATLAQSGSGKTPEASTDVGKSAKWDSLSHQGRSGDSLFGKVMVVGGALPWDPIPITVMCDGKIRYTADANPNGDFEIAAVATSSSTLGIEGAKTKPSSEFVGCTVEAALPGFNSTTLNIANSTIVDNPDIGTIKLSREEGAAGAVSSTTASAPKEAAKAFEKARSEWQEQKPDRAQRDLEKAVQVYPQFAEAWYSWERFRR